MLRKTEEKASVENLTAGYFFVDGFYMLKNRAERRRAKQNPECPPEYKRFQGYMY